MEHFLVNGRKFIQEGLQYWRINHDNTLWRPNLPEVFPFEPSIYVPFGRSLQLLEKSLNPTMPNTKWRNLHLGGNGGNKATAFNNRQGFEMDGDPRADYINGRNLDRPVPKQEVLACGGAILLQKRVDNQYLYPHYIDTNLPIPTLQYVEENEHLRFDALSIDGGPNGTLILRRFPQGEGERVRILLLSDREIRIPLYKVTKLPFSSIFPSPYQYP